MATASEEHCPICLYTWNNATCPVRCDHRFCFKCIQQQAETDPECLVCRRRTTVIQHLLRGETLEEDATRPPAASLGRAEEEGAYGLPPPRASQVPRPSDGDAELLGGLHAMEWGSLFRKHPALLQLLWPWLRQELGRMFEEDPPQALMLEEMVLSALPVYGLHEGHLVEVLRADLGVGTILFVQGLIKFTAEHLERPAHQILRQDECRAASRSQDSPGAAVGSAVFSWRRECSPGASTSWVAFQERLEDNLVVRSTSAGFYEAREFCVVNMTGWADIQGGRECNPGAHTSSVAFHGGQELGEAVVSASAPSRGRSCSPQGPRRPLKRKADSSQDSDAPAKKPPPRGC